MSDAFETLAQACGVQRRYVDGIGHHRVASDESVMAVLRAMGCDIRRPDDAPRELNRFDEISRNRLIEPVAVIWEGRPTLVLVNSEAMSNETLHVAISPSVGPSIEWDVRRDDLRRSKGGKVGFRIPETVGTGLHQIEVTCGAVRSRATLIVAPPRCYRPTKDGMELGVFLPLYAARSESNLGVGSYGDLSRLQDWAGGCGATYLGTLPLLTTYLDEPFEPSPYSPISRSVFGELFIDMHDASERHPLPTLQSLLLDPSFAEVASSARSRELVKYREAWSLVRRCLEAVRDDVDGNSSLREQVDAFASRDALCESYARFRGELANRSGRDADAEERLYLCAQWLVNDQLERLSHERREAAAGLYLDLPVGANGGGFDAHRYPDLYAHTVSLGAPPDALFRGGQTWGFPPQIPERSRALGHVEFAEAIERHMRFAEALRIDHAAGLHRCFWVPNGAEATDGVYVKYPHREYYAILSLLSHRQECLVIGENLGTVPQEVNDGLRRRGVLGMSIGQFELGREHAPLPEPGHRTLASLNTHDMPTFAAHWQGLDIDLHAELGIIPDESTGQERRERLAARERVVRTLHECGLLDTGDESILGVLRGLLRHMASSEADCLVVNLEDLWGETRPQNVPGTVDEYPNWRRKASRTIENISHDERIDSLLRELRRVSGEPTPAEGTDNRADMAR